MHSFKITKIHHRYLAPSNSFLPHNWNKLLSPKFRLAAIVRRSTIFTKKVAAINNLASITAVTEHC